MYVRIRRYSIQGGTFSVCQVGEQTISKGKSKTEAIR
jgi:hypothetical protein